MSKAAGGGSSPPGREYNSAKNFWQISIIVTCHFDYKWQVKMKSFIYIVCNVINESYVNMSRFTKSNFFLIIREIEEMENRNENIWVPIGILEYMYDDDVGLINQYFLTPLKSRNINILWQNVLLNLKKILT